jgi:peptidoglycan/LPS O-acetylase OafA/YrhL
MQTMGVNFLSIAINYHLTHTRADAILFGCISAVLLAMIPQKYIAVSQRPVFFSMGFVLLLGCFIYRSDYFRETFRYSLQGIAFMLIIPPLIFGNGYQALQKILSDKRLVFIGKLSYSLYLYHWLAMRAMDTATHANGKLTFNAYLLAAVIGVMLSIINYFIVEIPMKSVRRKFGSNTI